MIGLLTRFLVRILLGLIFYSTPVLGFWLASSLAAYLGGPPWVAWTVGALMFPVIPGVLEFHAWTHRRPNSKAWLTPIDRLSLRTFAVGLTFLAVLLYFNPQTAFVALSTRGDWMLDGVRDHRADSARRVLFAAAGGLEWLYRATKSNPYKAHIDKEARQRSEEAEHELAKQQGQDSAARHEHERVKQDGTKTTKETDQEVAEQDDTELSQNVSKDANDDALETTEKQDEEVVQKHKQNFVQLTNTEKKWPWKQAVLHHAVVTMPASVETSIKSVARYLAKQEKDPTLRIKALHDYVADRIAYDSDAFYSGNIPDQDAQSVFKTRKSVCAGYANLLSALAAAINEKIVVVTGDARDPTNPGQLTDGRGHAWNAARIGGRWYLIDACWDSGNVSREKGFTKSYRTDYLLPPPEVMIADHFPEEKTWQLLAQPLSQGEFLRRPMLRPSFRSADLILVSPQRAQNEAKSKAVVIVKNPDNQWLMAGLEQDGKEIGDASMPTNSETAQLERVLPDKGTYRLNMFVSKSHKYGQYGFVGSVDFVNR